mmetsp:Transcript_75068/g.67455  ORF Transcript_75068/g.67455 Transcript_75068/m.67455 type:complete len:342 (+) Transcript_75068:3-1028(+)
MIAQAYVGFITFIINLVLLHFFIGNIKTANANTKIIVYLALLVVISSIIYCFSSSIIMSDAIFGIQLTDEICVFAFRWVYAWWTIQRYFVYLFFIYRLKTIFENSPFAVSKKCIVSFVIIVSFGMFALLLSWVILYPTMASYDGNYSECTTSLDDDGYQILVISAIILIDIFVAISTLVYFVRRLFALIPEKENIRWYHCFICRCCFHRESEQGDEMKNIAFKALRYGIIAILSTLLFYFATIIVDSLGHILQIDSVINSFCIVAVFQWEDQNFFYRYGLWWMWNKQIEKERQNKDVIEASNTAQTKETVATASSTTGSSGAPETPTNGANTSSKIEFVLH